MQTATSVAEAATVSPGDEIPTETQGPYPADGSNGPNVLGDGSVVRSDLTTSFGEFSGVADGIPMDITLNIVSADTGQPLAGAAVYLWHCTADGKYSIYEVTDQNYLRGLQQSDASGQLVFNTIFPGCYRGRWPHCHFEIFPDAGSATSGSASLKVSQLALPEADCLVAYTDSRYGESARNLGQLSLESDMVFADGWVEQLATVSGSPESGYTARLVVRV